METWQIAAIGVAVAALIGALGWVIYERNRSRRLREHFGGEYDRRVTEIGDRRRAEFDLTHREARVRGLRLRPLSPSDRENFVEQWRRCQERFVDSPAEALDKADWLLADTMHARGYPIDDPTDRVIDFCATYPENAANLREANEILIKSHAGLASTEELRKAFVCFRSLYDEVLEGQDELKRAS